MPEQFEQLKEIVANQSKQIDLSKIEIEQLKTTNEKLDKQVAVAISDSESAKKDAKFSKVTTIVSIRIAAIALITSVVTLLIQ